MTFERDELFVWIWLPGASEPVVAGKLFREGGVFGFIYGNSYLADPAAISIFEPELPLSSEPQFPATMPLHGCIADASPDAWGRRVVDRLLGVGVLADEFDYLRHSGSDRIGALDFQERPDSYRPRTTRHASLDELADAARRIDEDEPISSELSEVLLHGSSIGGARPKALLDDGDRRLIAKFSSSTDQYPIVKAEFLAMRLAARCGIDVAGTELTTAFGKDVLLVERFDRAAGGARRSMVSALTILGLPDTAQRDGSYELLAIKMRERFADHRADQRELFARIAFNILCGNTDDHLRNHSAFWDGRGLSLTPAYDICPYPRTGEASLATAIDLRYRLANLAGLADRAALFQLSRAEAREIIDDQVSVVERSWDEVCDEASLAGVARDQLKARSFLHPAIFYGY